MGRGSGKLGVSDLLVFRLKIPTPYFQLVQRRVSSLLPLLSKTTIDNKNELCGNQKDRRSHKMQLRPFVADNLKKQIPHLSKMPYRNIQEETFSNSEKRGSGTKAVRDGAEGIITIMTFSDDVLAGNYDGLCDICNYHHNVIIISLEGGGHIVTRPFPKEPTIVAKVKPGIEALFWRED